ncbi:nitrogen regulation protein NR(II) [Solimonas soli]|uniref:nitrogen regulation protein NR(II) n=1 Tax=Solimonas soli TaxID=413479 RepID=UPI0005BB162E|nr:nitrogen regulation protein NR(II) [Solimonas soli]
MKLGVRSRVTAEDVIDGLTTAVVALDEGLRVSMINSAAEGLFEVSRRLALGAPLAEAMPHFGPHQGRLQDALDRSTGFIERETRLARNGSPAVTVDLTATPFVVGKKPGLLLEMLPVDRHLRISRDELFQSQFDASRELIRGLAHEIKNPLGGIRGAAQLLEHEFPDSQHREYTRVIIREVDRLQNLVNRMLGPNRAPQKVLLNIHELLEHVRRLVQAEAPAEVAVLRDYDPSIPEVVVDREQIIQAVLNILRNALQAVGNSGLITLRTRTRRQLTIAAVRHKLVVQIDIEDNGPGVPRDMMEKIFYPMVTTRAEGTGLGLPLSQYLVHSHGGLIECRSRPGCTVFSIYLPIETA